jgi:peptide/nickel transport system ATP-binding protein
MEMSNTGKDTQVFLSVENLTTEFNTDNGKLVAVDGISFNLKSGEILGLVGESGCGKSVTSLSILRLIQSPGKISKGRILFKGQDLLTLSDEAMRKIRGNEIAMIFQEPMTSLNPVYTCGEQIEEVIRLHRPHLKKAEVKATAIDALKSVGIPAPEKRYDEFPHQLSGGMRQRVMIAMAMSCNPQLLIADEPTTALDVTIQAQILDLMRKLMKDFGSSMILITHDLGVVAEMCHQVAIMYAGQIVEMGPVEQIFYQPKHPYTQGLLNSIPHFKSGEKLDRLRTIPGMVPNLLSLPTGCRFHDRCDRSQKKCKEIQPMLEVQKPGHLAACHFPLEERAH